MGVSVPHFWLAIVLVIIFSVELGMLAADGIGPENATGWRLDGRTSPTWSCRPSPCR
jgi:ABC-type dipeptide/oligopeptide/nickel transport systems, permease components